MLARLQQKFPEEVRIAFRHFPLNSIHDNAALAAQASEAAGAQGEFWAMHDLLFESQSEWSGLSVQDFEAWLIDQAAELGLDAGQFEADLNSPENAEMIQEAWDRGVEIGLPGTPFLLVNNQIWPNNLPMSEGNLTSIVQLNLLERQQFASCPPMTIEAHKQYFATLNTEKGDITIELYPEEAPLAVNNFIFLARNGWYDDVTFHRVLPDFMAQAGDPSGTGFGGPGYAFVNESSEDLNFDEAGVVAMANAGPDSNGSQFFITLGPASHLEGNYTIFGQVVEGMDVVEELSPRDPSQSLDLPPGDKILGVEIEEK